MFTNLDNIKAIAKQEEAIVKSILELGLTSEICKGICDTDKCPYFDNCHEGSNCQLSDEEQIRIWLHMEAKV